MKNSPRKQVKTKALKAALSLLVLAAVSLSALFSVFMMNSSALAMRYSVPAAGTLLYTMNFKERIGWDPKKGEKATSVLSVVAVDSDPLFAKVTATTNSANHNWGGDIEGLPLNDYTAYTIFYTVKRSKETATRDPNLGVYIDGFYGYYGYSGNLRLLAGMDNIPGHTTIDLNSFETLVEGNTWETTGESVEHFAIEVNGTSKTIKVFVMDVESKYILVDYTTEGEIESFKSDTLGLWFHQYNTEMPVLFGNFTVWKGNILTGEKVANPPETKVTETTAAPEETTSPAETTAEETTSAPEETTGEDTQGENTGKGCGSSAAFASCLIAVIPSASLLVKRKKEN